jgi:hypothetical protein
MLGATAIIGTSGTKTLGISTGTTPTSAPADACQLFSKDANAAAGKAALHVINECGTSPLIVACTEIKTTAGDSAEVMEGKIQINTFDYTIKMYAGSAWRTLSSDYVLDSGDFYNHVVLGSDQTRADTGFGDLTGLSFTMEASGTYIIEAYLMVKSTNTAYGGAISCNGPASPIVVAGGSQWPTSITASSHTNCGGYDLPSSIVTALPASDEYALVQYKVMVVNGANAGTFILRWKCENASYTLTCRTGSFLRWRKIA